MSVLIKQIAVFAFAMLLISKLSYSQQDMNMTTDEKKSADVPEGIKMEDGILYGKEYSPELQIVEFTEFIKSPDGSSGKEVLLKGKVAEVCQAMGCWMTMTEGGNTVRVKTGHNFFLPKDISGKDAVVIGKFSITEISQEEAQHYNEESANPSTEEIKGPQKVYEIDAYGVKILFPAAEQEKN